MAAYPQPIDPLRQQQAQQPEYGGINPAANPAAPRPAGVDPAKGAMAPPAAPAQGAPGGQAPPAGTAPPPAKTYNVGDFQSWAQQRYGRQATQGQLKRIAGHVGYQGDGSGITQDQYTRAQAYADEMAKQMGWQPPAGSGAPGPVTGGGGGQQVQSELQRRLLEMLGTHTGDVNTGSQEYQSQLGSFKRSQQTAMERAKRHAAERASIGGTLGSGGFDAGMTGIDLAGAQQVGDFEAGLAGQQIGRQREDLQNAMQMAMQGGLANEARQLGSQDLDLRRYLGRGQLGLGLLGTLLGDQRSRDALGFNYASLGNQINQQTLQQLLAGL